MVTLIPNQKHSVLMPPTRCRPWC